MFPCTIKYLLRLVLLVTSVVVGNNALTEMHGAGEDSLFMLVLTDGST